MDYQKIRAALEKPLLDAFQALTPPVPVYFDNITAAPKNTTTEYVRVNLTFGLTTEPTLSSNFDYARGAIIIRVATEKGRGPARNQTLVTEAVKVLETLNNKAKTSTGVFFRLGQIDGPSFMSDEVSPHFMSRIDSGYTATVLS